MRQSFSKGRNKVEDEFWDRKHESISTFFKQVHITTVKYEIWKLVVNFTYRIFCWVCFCINGFKNSNGEGSGSEGDEEPGGENMFRTGELSHSQ